MAGQPLTFGSRLRKLRAMKAAEILSRLGDRAFLAVERRQLQRDSGHDGERLLRALEPRLRHAPDWQDQLLAGRATRARFFPPFHDAARMREHFHRDLVPSLEQARTHADAAAARRFEFFGQTFALGPALDWHADPVSGNRWPDGFHADVPTSGYTVCGDVKYVWELSRHQFLIDLGKAAFLLQKPAYAGHVIELVRSWIHQNPYGRGVNWASPLEPAFRILSWLPAYYYCLEGAALTPANHLTWLAGFHDHGRFLHRHLEYYASPFNHLIGEACALYMLGVLFPEFQEAAAWRRRGRRVLESRLPQQFYRDGGGAEQATFYHHATLGFYLLAALLGRANGEEFAAATWETIERAVEFSMFLARPDGGTPSVGDADDGRPIRFEHRPLWDFRAFQSIAAVLFRRTDFKTSAGGFHEDALWLLGLEGRDVFERLPGTPPAEVSRAFPHSGYFVLRSDWSSTADYVLFDCGEQGSGARHDDVPDALHGHADCLAVVACLGGQPLLVDSGFLCYNGPDEWQNQFRKTAAHNTVVVDGRDQSRHLGKMAWSHTPRWHQESWIVDEQGSRVAGSHDGYARTAAGVLHRRSVWLRPSGYFALYDELTGSGDHRIQILFHFPPSASTLPTTDGLVVSDQFSMTWHANVALTPSLARGGPSAADGWIAPSLGVKEAAPQLSLAAEFASPHTGVVTVCADRRRVQEIRSLASAGPEQRGLAMLVRTDHATDVIVAAQGRPIRMAGLESDAGLIICRLPDAGRGEAAAVGQADVRFDPFAFRAGLGLP